MEAARALAHAHAHAVWNGVRQHVVKILGKEHHDLTGDDMSRISSEDIAALSPDGQAAVLQRMEHLVAMERLDAESVAAKRAQL
jgi:hypothetical protein